MVGGLDIGFVPGKGGVPAAKMGGLDVVFMLGADEIDIKGKAFKVYIGSHGDKGAHGADVILPGAAYTEKSALYVNTEGRPQMTARAAFAPGDAREDWAIFRALSDALGHTLPFDNLNELRKQLFADHPHLAALGDIIVDDGSAVAKLAKGAKKMSKAAFVPAVSDFYLTNPIARASKVMADCSALAANQRLEAAE